MSQPIVPLEPSKPHRFKKRDSNELLMKVRRGEITIFIGKLLKLIEKGQENMLFKLDKLNSQIAILNDRIKQLEISEIEMNLLFVLSQKVCRNTHNQKNAPYYALTQANQKNDLIIL